MNNIFYGKSVDGEIVWDNKKGIKNFLQSINNKKIVIQIEKERGIRSNNQNSWLWSCVYKIIADETGHTENELHDLFKRLFLPPKYKEVLGKQLKLPASTTDLSKVEFGEYVEKIRAEVANLGIVIPDPNKHYQLIT